MLQKIKSFFKLDERGGTFRLEILGGLTTFLAMAYILFVNPSILGAAGVPMGVGFLATALAAAFASIFMGLFANLPVGLAPGMGLNAFFAFTIVIGMGYSWQEALGIVFVSGVLYLIISVAGLRRLIVQSIPQGLKYAVAAGIGFFIAFIGLINAGIIVSNPDTLVGIGNLSDPMTLLALGGLFLTIILLSLKVKGAVFIGLVTTLIANIVLTAAGVFAAPVVESITPGFAPIKEIFGSIPKVISTSAGWTAIIAFLFVDFFDTAGTLLAVTGQMPFLTEKDIDKANIVDATSTMVGAALGTSTTTSYIESLAGTGVGARTGLSAVIVGFLFLLGIVAYPVLPYASGAVTSAATIIVGTMMASSIGKIKWEDEAIGLASFITILAMVVTYSISNGIGFGFITYSIAMLASKRGKEVHWMFYLVSVLFLLHYIFL